MGPSASKRAIGLDQRVQNGPASFRQVGKSLTQAAFQALQNHRNQCHVCDFVASKRLTNVFRTKGTQMHNGGAASKRSDEADHEIDGVVRGQDAQIAYAWPERKQRSESHALLKIILVRQHAAFRMPPGTGGINNARGVLPAALHESWFAPALKFFP